MKRFVVFARLGKMAEKRDRPWSPEWFSAELKRAVSMCVGVVGSMPRARV
jgi:hypothetical protein